MAKNTANQKIEDQTDDEMEDGILDYSESIEDAERPEPLPEGTYTGVIQEVTRRKSQKDGRPYLSLKIQINSDQMPADFVSRWMIEQRTVVANQFVCEDTPQSRYNMRRLCEAIGAPMKGTRVNYKEWVGMEAKVELNHQDDLQGLPRENVKRIVSD